MAKQTASTVRAAVFRRKWLRQAIESHLGPKETDRSWDLEAPPSDVRQFLVEKSGTRLD